MQVNSGVDYRYPLTIRFIKLTATDDRCTSISNILMAKARALDKRRKCDPQHPQDHADDGADRHGPLQEGDGPGHAATAYTRRITQLVADLANSGLEVKHPLLEGREKIERAMLLVLTANRGLCGGYNSNVQRAGFARYNELKAEVPEVRAGNLRQAGHCRGQVPRHPRRTKPYTHFEDKPSFEEVEVLANRYLEDYIAGKLDRLDVAYMQFESVAGRASSSKRCCRWARSKAPTAEAAERRQSQYEFLPSAESILEEVVPTSFKVKLFKCFLDAAVSEQVARMVAMKAATKNAGDRIRQLSMAYNRARQSQITGEIMEIIGGVEALKK